jgi:hypothetical protein
MMIMKQDVEPVLLFLRNYTETKGKALTALRVAEERIEALEVFTASPETLQIIRETISDIEETML